MRFLFIKNISQAVQILSTCVKQPYVNWANNFLLNINKELSQILFKKNSNKFQIAFIIATLGKIIRKAISQKMTPKIRHKFFLHCQTFYSSCAHMQPITGNIIKDPENFFGFPK